MIIDNICNLIQIHTIQKHSPISYQRIQLIRSCQLETMVAISYSKLERMIREGVEGYLENEWDNIIDAITKNIMISLAQGSDEEYRIYPDD